MGKMINKILFLFGLIKVGLRTEQYYTAYYTRGGRLEIGDYVWVHPAYNLNNKETGLSISREKYKAQIQLRPQNWTTTIKHSNIYCLIKSYWIGLDEIYYGFTKINKQYEICTFVKGKHGAVLNDYLFNRLEKING